jgi:pimeloyl-ACP methyl ester carboxylesterase
MASIYKNSEAKDVLMKLYDEKLATCTVPYESVYVETQAGTTHVLITGAKDAPPLVAFHGIHAGSAVTLEALQGLASTYRLYCIDTIGQATRSAATLLPLKDDSIGRWVEEVLQELQLTTASFVGVSYGGFILQKLMAYAPERIKKAILVVPGGLANGKLGPSLKYLTLPLLKFMLTKKGIHLQTFMDAFYTDIDSSARTFQRTLLQDIKLDYRRPPLSTADDMKNVTAPVYIIVAENDIFFPSEESLERCKTIFPNFTDSYILIGSKHIPSPTSFPIIEKQIRTWLA